MSILLDGLLNPPQDLLLLSLALRTTTHSALAHQSLHRPPQLPLPPSLHTLHIPPLRIPWATSLAALLHRHLNLSLHTPTHTTPLSPSFVQTLLSTPLSSPHFQQLASKLYPHLSPLDNAHNAATLARLREVYPPNALDRIATSVKLAFVASLLRTLNSHSEKLSVRLGHLRANFSDGSGAHVALVRGNRGRMRKRAVVAVRGRWIEGKGESRRVYFLEGAFVEERLVNAVAALLKAKYGVEVQLDLGTGRGCGAGTLVSLSNAGTALMGVGVEGDVRERWKAMRGMGESLSSYLWERFSVKWSVIYKALVREAEGIVDAEELDALPRKIKEVDEATRLAEEVREGLVGRAIAHETAGSSLSWICAFKLAQMGNKEELDGLLKGFHEEHEEMVKEARGVIRRLEQGCVQGIWQKR